MSSAAVAGTSVRSLPDLCAGLFAYVLWLRAQPPAEAPGIAVIQQRLDELLRGIDTDGQRAGTTPERVRLALFALVAFCDEMVLSSQLPCRGQWAEAPMQLTYFNENAAGDEFYVRLDAIRTDSSPANLDLIECFYLCLSLGFKGRYAGTPRQEKHRRSLMDELARDLTAARGAAGSLSGSLAALPGIPPLPRRISVWLIPCLLILGLVGFIVVLNLLLQPRVAAAASAFIPA
jgi:type VI secretion system protein ImpK